MSLGAGRAEGQGGLGSCGVCTAPWGWLSASSWDLSGGFFFPSREPRSVTEWFGCTRVPSAAERQKCHLHPCCCCQEPGDALSQLAAPWEWGQVGVWSFGTPVSPAQKGELAALWDWGQVGCGALGHQRGAEQGCSELSSRMCCGHLCFWCIWGLSSASAALLKPLWISVINAIGRQSYNPQSLNVPVNRALA